MQRAAFSRVWPAISAAVFCALGTVFGAAAAEPPPLAPRPTADAYKPWVLALAHGNAAVQTVYSPKGDTFVSAGHDGSVFLHDAATGSVVRAFPPSGKYVNCVAFTPDGSSVVVGAGDNTVMGWDARFGRPTALLPSEAHPETEARGVTSLAFSPDGKVLAAGSNGNLRIWDWEARKLIRKISIPTGGSFQLRFARDNKTLLGGQIRGPVSAWDTETGTQTTTYGETDGQLLTISPDARQLVFRGLNRVVLWDVETNKQTIAITPPGIIASAVFSADGTRLLGSVSPGLLVIWNTAKGEIVQAADTGANFIPGDKAGIALSPDARWIAAGSDKGVVRTWNAATAEMVADIPSMGLKTNAVVAGTLPGMGGTAGCVIASYSDGAVRVWDAATGQPRETLSYHGHEAVRIALTQDGTMLAISYGWPGFSTGHQAQGVAFQEIQLLDTATWQVTQTIRVQEAKDAVNSLSFSPDGSTLAAGTYVPGAEGGAWEWDVKTGEVKRRLAETKVRVMVSTGPFNDDKPRPAAVAYAPGGKLAVVSSRFGNGLQFWRNGEANPLLTKNDEDWTGLTSIDFAFLPDGKNLAAARKDGVALWNIDAAKWQPVSDESGEAAAALSVSPDGSLLAASTSRTRAKLWSLPNMKLLGYLGTQIATDLAFTADGRKLATAEMDGAIRLWNPRTGDLVATLQMLPPDGSPGAKRTAGEEWIAYTPTGSFAASEGATKWIKWQDRSVKRETLERPDVLVAALAKQ